MVYKPHYTINEYLTLLAENTTLAIGAITLSNSYDNVMKLLHITDKYEYDKFLQALRMFENAEATTRLLFNTIQDDTKFKILNILDSLQLFSQYESKLKINDVYKDDNTFGIYGTPVIHIDKGTDIIHNINREFFLNAGICNSELLFFVCCHISKFKYFYNKDIFGNNRERKFG